MEYRCAAGNYTTARCVAICLGMSGDILGNNSPNLAGNIGDFAGSGTSLAL